MRALNKITVEQENYRTVELIPGNHRFLTSRKDPVEPEPVGTYIAMIFRIIGYDQDCDGSLMARLEHVNSNGEHSGWSPHHLGLYPDSEVVLDNPRELHQLLEGNVNAK